MGDKVADCLMFSPLFLTLPELIGKAGIFSSAFPSGCRTCKGIGGKLLVLDTKEAFRASTDEMVAFAIAGGENGAIGMPLAQAINDSTSPKGTGEITSRAWARTILLKRFLWMDFKASATAAL